ncbi:MAG TPA: SpoIID/LytB domain-containing protein [Bacillota bacterium]|nr:SpoIID/LytB domain-containing protein [Bacillota bacterium]HPT86679.1 SpoIID/LytB domain-containing protein [Bacillota bacterium]
MRRILWVTFVLLTIGILGPSVFGEEERWIRIGLIQNQSTLELTTFQAGEQLVAVIDGIEQAIPFEGTQLIFTWDGQQILVNNVPVSAGRIILKPGTSLLGWNQRRYRGELIVTAINGKLQLVNRLLLEDYLRGVVPKEVPPAWPLAALKAQAIAARTYTAASFNRHGKDGFDLCAATHCQVYGGADGETPMTDEAVLETAGQVIVYNGKIISAAYHASSGGYTKDAAGVWGFSTPYLVSVPDWDQNSPYTAWNRALDWNQVQGLISRSYPKIGRAYRVVPEAYNSLGYCTKIKLLGDLGTVTVTAEQFRVLLGLPSANVQLGMVYGPEPWIHLWWVPGRNYPEAIILGNSATGMTVEVLSPPWDQPDAWAWLRDKEPVQLVIKGAGYGHGVGLSQWGAKGMADAGFNERQILEYYYKGVRIVSLDEVR